MTWQMADQLRYFISHSAVPGQQKLQCGSGVGDGCVGVGVGGAMMRRCVHVRSENNFPRRPGLASSASGYACMGNNVGGANIRAGSA